MAEKKNFIIENYNGTDYDTLYPQTNSGQVLLDTTAQAVTNLPSGKTLDDALQHITKDGGGFQVGDTLTTARTNLGDKWLLCNGDILRVGQYPELDGVLSQKYLHFNKIQGSTFNAPSSIIDVQLVSDEQNKQIVLKSQFRGSSSGYVYAIRYANIINTNWEWNQISSYKDVTSSENQTYVHHANGVWFFNDKYYIGTLTDESSFSTLNKPDGAGRVADVKYVDGKYYILFLSSANAASGGKIAVYSNLAQLPDATFTAYAKNNGLGIAEGNNGVIFCSKGSGTSSPYKPTFSILIGNSVTQTNNNTTPFQANICKYFNGYYYYFGNYKIANAQSFAENPVEISYAATTIEMTDSFIFNNTLLLNNGYYTKDGTEFRQITGATITDGGDTTMTVNPSCVYIPQFSSANIDVYQSFTMPEIQLPTVSLSDGLYTYIKAKS